MQLLKMHLGLLKYIIQELPKIKGLKNFILFFKTILKAYLKELLRLYKNVFLILDPEYRKQKTQFDKYQNAKKEVVNALKLLKYVKVKMQKAGLPRQRIRRFFLELGRDDDALNKLVDDLMKEI
jgi:hypothetical protein